MTAPGAWAARAQPARLLAAAPAAVATAVVAAFVLAGLGGSGAWADDALFIAMWTSMVALTMLPTAVPMVAAARRVMGGRSDTRSLTLSLLAGYLGVWLLAGVAVRAAQLMLIAATGRATHDSASMPGMHMAPSTDARTTALITGAALAAGGLFQLSPLAVRCLRACRAPFGFFARGWTGAPDVHRQSLRIGAAYGVSCLGCCAALMALPPLAGLHGMLWMGAGGALVAAQKNLRAGAQLARATGVLLLVAGAVAAARPELTAAPATAAAPGRHDGGGSFALGWAAAWRPAAARHCTLARRP